MGLNLASILAGATGGAVRVQELELAEQLRRDEDERRLAAQLQVEGVRSKERFASQERVLAAQIARDDRQEAARVKREGRAETDQIERENRAQKRARRVERQESNKEFEGLFLGSGGSREELDRLNSLRPGPEKKRLRDSLRRDAQESEFERARSLENTALEQASGAKQREVERLGLERERVAIARRQERARNDRSLTPAQQLTSVEGELREIERQLPERGSLEGERKRKILQSSPEGEAFLGGLEKRRDELQEDRQFYRNLGGARATVRDGSANTLPPELESAAKELADQIQEDPSVAKVIFDNLARRPTLTLDQKESLKARLTVLTGFGPDGSPSFNLALE